MFSKIELMKFGIPGPCPKCQADSYIEEVIYSINKDGNGVKTNIRVCSKCHHSFETQGGTNQSVVDALKRNDIGHNNIVGQYIVKKTDIPQ